jgi:hypothetical protein
MRAMSRPVLRVTSLPVLVRIVAFVVICVAPVIAWTVFGTVDPYGRPHPRFPYVNGLLEGRAFDALGHAALERSIATRTAIWLKNNFDYKVLHQVNTELIVSGRDDWLFYKEEFWDAKCLQADKLRALLAQVDIMTDIAKAAGLDLIVSVSPDKSWIYPEKLAPQFHRYWKCKSDNSALWRKLAGTEAPRLIDHGVPLLAAKSKGATSKLYFYTDTHWTPYGAALGFRDLLKAIFPSAPVAAAPLQTRGTSYHKADMGNFILLLEDQEPVDEIDDGIASVVRDEAKTIFIHDSFYASLTRQMSQVFPNSMDYGYQDKKSYARAILMADRLIINSVERSFFMRLKSGDLNPSSDVAQAILERNSKAAEACVNFKPIEVGVGNQDGSQVATLDHGQAAGEPIQPRVPRFSPCLKLELKGGRGRLEVFLPEKGRNADVFEPGRSAVYERTNTDIVAMVLPDYVRGRMIKIVPSGDVRISSAEFGDRRATTAANP